MLTAAQRKKWDSPVAKKVGTLSPFQLFVVCLITCIAVASVYWTQVVLAEVGAAFDVSAAQARLAFSACSIAYAISFFLFAPFADRISARKLAQFGLCATAITVGASATVNSFNVLTSTSASSHCKEVSPLLYRLPPSRLCRVLQKRTSWEVILAWSSPQPSSASVLEEPPWGF